MKESKGATGRVEGTRWLKFLGQFNVFFLIIKQSSCFVAIFVA